MICRKYCKSNHKRITCYKCNHVIHEKCKGPNFGRFLTDPVIDSSNFYCDSCSDADETLTAILPNLETSSIISSDIDFSDAHSSDF